MSSKQRPPLTPADSRYAGPNSAGVHLLIWASQSRDGVEHETYFYHDLDGALYHCRCEWFRHHFGCKHVDAASDALDWHLNRPRPPADPGGAALDAAQTVMSAEIADWTATMPATRRLDVRVAATNGAWIQSHTAAGVRLTCTSCHDVRGWATEAEAAEWLVADGRCRCGGGEPPAPAHGGARKPLDDCLHDLYGPE